MTKIDEIEELRAELRHSHLTDAERRAAEARLAQLLLSRDGHTRDATVTVPSNSAPRRDGSTAT